MNAIFTCYICHDPINHDGICDHCMNNLNVSNNNNFNIRTITNKSTIQKSDILFDENSKSNNIKCECGNDSIIGRTECIICFDNKINPLTTITKQSLIYCIECEKNVVAMKYDYCSDCIENEKKKFNPCLIFCPSVVDFPPMQYNISQRYITIMMHLKKKLLDISIFFPSTLQINYKHNELIKKFATNEQNILGSEYDIIRMHMLMCCEKYIFVLKNFFQCLKIEVGHRLFKMNRDKYLKKLAVIYDQEHKIIELLNTPIKYYQILAFQIILSLKTKKIPKFLVAYIVFLATGLRNTFYDKIFESIDSIHYKYSIDNEQKINRLKQNSSLYFNQWFNDLKYQFSMMKK